MHKRALILILLPGVIRIKARRKKGHQIYLFTCLKQGRQMDLYVSFCSLAKAKCDLVEY